MDENGVDRLRNLPDSLLIQILLNLTTKDVVKTSLLSSKWKNFWRYVPGLELEPCIFPNHNDFVRFVDSFLCFHRETLLEKFVLKYDRYAERRDGSDYVKRCINTVAEQNKVQHLHVSYNWTLGFEEMPSSIYTCESLVSLKLSALVLPSLGFFTLPSLRVMDLGVTVTNTLVLESLILHSPVLESLSIRCSFHDYKQVLRVCSHSLLSFVYDVALCTSDGDFGGVAIDTPRLEYLRLGNDESGNIVILNNPPSLFKVDISFEFNWGGGNNLFQIDLPTRNMMRNFIPGISSVKEMIISLNTLKVYDYSRFDPLPLFRNLAFLHLKFYEYYWEFKLLPFFLESCPNLKSLVVGFDISGEWASMDDSDPGSRCSLASQLYKLVHGSRCSQASQLFPGSRCSLASLEYVEIKWQPEVDEKVTKLVGYLLLMSTNLKKLTLTSNDFEESEDESFILEELNAIPRVSSICQFAVRPYYSKY